MKLGSPGGNKEGLDHEQAKPGHEQDAVNVDDVCLVHKFWKLAGVGMIETPLNTKDDQYNKDRCVPKCFIHAMCLGLCLKG